MKLKTAIQIANEIAEQRYTEAVENYYTEDEARDERDRNPIHPDNR